MRFEYSLSITYTITGRGEFFLIQMSLFPKKKKKKFGGWRKGVSQKKKNFFKKKKKDCEEQRERI